MSRNRRSWRRASLALLLAVWCVVSLPLATGRPGSLIGLRPDSLEVDAEHGATRQPVAELVAPTDELLAGIRSDFESYSDTLLERMKPVFVLLGARGAAALNGGLFAQSAEALSVGPFHSLVTGHVRLQI